MIQMDVTKNFNLNNISLDLKDELNKGIEIVARDIQSGIERGSQFGVPFDRNTAFTIKKKGFDWPLKETGLMMDAKRMQKQYASTGKQVSTLMPNIKRVAIATKNQDGDPDEFIPARPFFGVSDKSDKKVIDMVLDKIDREIKSA